MCFYGLVLLTGFFNQVKKTLRSKSPSEGQQLTSQNMITISNKTIRLELLRFKIKVRQSRFVLGNAIDVKQSDTGCKSYENIKMQEMETAPVDSNK